MNKHRITVKINDRERFDTLLEKLKDRTKLINLSRSDLSDWLMQLGEAKMAELEKSDSHNDETYKEV